MIKRLLALLLIHTIIFSFAGCSNDTSKRSSEEIEIIVDDEVIIEKEEDDTVSTESNVSSVVSEPSSSEETPVSSEQPSSSSQESSTISTPVEDNKINIDYDWKSHSEDYKLIAFTFDDGPGDLMSKYVEYFAAFDGAGTFFVNGTKIKGSYEYGLMQDAVNYGWDIGNHGDKHLVATIGGGGGTEASYDAIKEDINNLTHKLESNLKNPDGTPYVVSCYRPPNIKPTANTFKICDELKLPVIWLKYDALDWDTTKTDKQREDVFKYGVGEWKDGDIILCHEVQQYADQTYASIEKYLPEFYRKGYRFCSISELMELRGITREQICGELNEVDGNRGMVVNILDAAAAGKK